MKNIISVISGVIFTDTFVFCLAILVSVDPQKCSLVWYTSKHGVANNPTLHYQHLNFVLVSLLLAVHTQHRILLHCLSQCLLCLVSRLFSLLMDGAWFLWLVVKMLSGERSASVWGGSVCRNPLGPPVNLLVSDTVIGQLILTVHCAKFVPVTHSVWLLSRNGFSLLINVSEPESTNQTWLCEASISSAWPVARYCSVWGQP